MADKILEKSFWSLEENIKTWVEWKPPSFPALLNLLTWDALPPNKCSCQLKHFVEGQNLPRRLMDKFNWQYKNCHIPMISASLHQDKVLGRGGIHGWGAISRRWTFFYLCKMLSLIFIFPNDMPGLIYFPTTTRPQERVVWYQEMLVVLLSFHSYLSPAGWTHIGLTCCLRNVAVTGSSSLFVHYTISLICELMRLP